MATQLRDDTERGPPYEGDFAAWAFYQAMLVRSGQWQLLDRYWLAEELDSLGRSEYRTLLSALARVLQHMLKWDHQPSKRTNSWARSIRDHRRIIADQLDESPSLKSRRDELVVKAYARAVEDAADETGMAPHHFPASCPFGWDEIMTRPVEWPPEDGQ